MPKCSAIDSNNLYFQVQSADSGKWVKCRNSDHNNHSTKKHNQGNIFHIIWFILVNDFCCFSYHPTRKNMQEIGTIFIAILKSYLNNKYMTKQLTQWAFTCSKLTIETLEQDVKYVQS